MFGRTASLIAIFVVGCGGTQKSSSDASGATGAERRCLEEAAAPPKPAENPPDEITISHIVVKYSTGDQSEGKKRTKGQACVRALDARDELRDGMDWADVVKSYSDAHEPNDGDLGAVKKKDLDPKIARAAFALNVKELSYVVEARDGFHIILRTK